MEWLDDALCRGKHQDLWFPPVFIEERTAPESHYYDIAKMVCEQCPIRERCEQLGAEEDVGVWGGWSPKDRKDGKRTLSKRVLPKSYVSGHIPAHSPAIRLDVPALKAELKGYTEKR
jgi:Transcription factor WhiB